MKRSATLAATALAQVAIIDTLRYALLTKPRCATAARH